MDECDIIEALLDIVDDTRSEDQGRSERLVVLGYAERSGKRGGFRPTNAGWNILGERGRSFYLSAH